QLDNGGIERGWLGVTIQPFDRELAAYFHVPDETGVVVSGVTPRSPAADAGIQPGDVLTDFAGAAIEAEKEEDLGNFQRVVARVAPGESASIALLRGGARKKVRVTLAEAPRTEAEELESDVGFHAQEITETIVRQNRLATRRGAYVSFVASGSPAAEAGLEPGDVIRRVEGRNVENLGELRQALARVDALPRFLVIAERGEETRLVLLRRGASTNDRGEPNGDTGEASKR
ncbi:MAG: degP, partial [Deltaproteobacteria bacterium]|nr:degP [Deltaproteobacteria bacterium]